MRVKGKTRERDFTESEKATELSPEQIAGACTVQYGSHEPHRGFRAPAVWPV